MFIIGFASRDEAPDHSEYPDWVIEMAEEAFDREISDDDHWSPADARKAAESAYRSVLEDFDFNTSDYYANDY